MKNKIIQVSRRMFRTLIFIFLVFSSCYESPDKMSLSNNELNEFVILNDYLIHSLENYNYYLDPLAIRDHEMRKRALDLQSKYDWDYIDISKRHLIKYKLKHQKKDPSIGMGYFSHYLIYTTLGEPDFRKMFNEDYELEEQYVKSKELRKHWYYVIGEHFSD